MADTVKKSRIVSEGDENLEESLLEEFNLRLKKCMSRDDLHLEAPEAHIYENVDAARTNGQPPTAPGHHNGITLASEEFLFMERKHCSMNGYDLVLSNGHEEGAELDEAFNLDSKVEDDIPECTKTELDQDVEEDVQKPSLNLPMTCLIDTSESFEAENPDVKSVKDRMFLSTDDASCLLFTQTVTSPMLTPSEENIDFLKGFRRESSQCTLSDHTNSNSPKSEPKSEEAVLHTTEDLISVANNKSSEEVIYENVEFLRDQNSKEIKDVDVTREEIKHEESENGCLLENEKDEHSIGLVDRVVGVLEDSLQQTAEHQCPGNSEENVCDNEYEEETHDVISQKLCFVDAEEETTFTSSFQTDTNEELSKLKSLNIIKQINKFENTGQNTEEVINVCSNISVSTVSESRFVETMTEVHTTGEITSLKKKKSKKSKSQHEKENISVSKTNTNELESFYNVNVKNLCRSFGDLTRIDDEQYYSWRSNERLRTKSMNDMRTLDVRKKIDNVFGSVSVKTLKSSFSKFDALQKKNVLNAKSPDQDNIAGDTMNCKKCGRPVFQMEKIVAERSVYHRNCFRCVECSKQLLVDNFETHEGTLYCKPHFKALFTPKAVEDDTPPKPRKHELIIRENQPAELPPDVARASDKPDLGLEELHSLNVKERFQVFENIKQTNDSQIEKNTVKMERSPSILSKLARFQAKGMNVGVTDEALNGVTVEASSSEEEEEEDDIDGEDADLIRAKRVQKEKPFHFSQMNDVKSKWEKGNQLQNRDERREERKQEIQSIRSRLFMGKQGKMKEAYQQAILESESINNMKKEMPIEAADTRSIKDRFEKGEIANVEIRNKESEDMSVFESGISKKSRSIFQELDASGVKPPKLTEATSPKLGNAVRSAREAYLAKQASQDTVKSSDQLDEITVRTSDIQDRFKFFETYKEPQQKRREFRMTPPREGQNKSVTPEREIYLDPDIVRSDDCIEDSVVAKATHTTTKMLSKFRQMEENLQKGQESQGPKPLKRFTPPREPIRRESSSEGEESGSEESEDEVDHRMPERDLLEAQKAARAKQLKAKFEHWEESETDMRRDTVNFVEEFGDEQSQVETAKSLRAKFELLREPNSNQRQPPRVKVNRFVSVSNQPATCDSCSTTVYPLEMIAVHGHVFHRSCFRCKECNAVLRMDSYSYNQGLLYCMTHFKRLFISKGNYDTAFGLEQHKDKWNAMAMV